MAGSPFALFSWRRPFLPALKDFIARRTDGCPGRALIVVPHNRPWRYLQHLYALDGRPTLLPKVMTVNEALRLWREQLDGAPVRTANRLDLVALLRACVAELSSTDAALAERFSRMDMEDFLPWGMRLADLLDELFSHGVSARDIAYMEGEVSPPAAALLNALGRLQEACARRLREAGWTTPGFEPGEVARLGTEVPACLLSRPERPVLLAGFALLTPAEDTLFRRLWEAGAEVCLHTDTALARGTSPHWACEEHAVWLRRWRAQAEVVGPEDAEGPEPELRFFAGYDLHSQLAALREALIREAPAAGGAVALDAAEGEDEGPEKGGNLLWRQDADASPSTAVVLTHNGLLLPVLHHLPRKDVNVSMGYPLDRSPLCRLLESLFRAQEERSADGRYFWRSLLDCLRHPYLAMLQQETPVSTGPGGPKQAAVPLRDALNRLCESIRRGSRTLRLEEVLAGVRDELEPAQAQALDELTRILFEALGAVRTCGELAEALAGICAWLEERGRHLWPHYPLDAEAMYRLRERCLPVLRRNALSGEPFRLRQLFQFARQILQAERIPFEAVPLTGLQVLGMLETRLLHFDRVHIVDATDENLPGSAAQDPLLPDSLRRELGLPDARQRAQVAAHTLFRLCAGARTVSFYWQEGIARSALFDTRKSRSRFVEQLIWQEERRRGALLVPGEGPLRTPSGRARPSTEDLRPIARTPALREAMRRFLNGCISPTALDTYLACPKCFVWFYLCRLREAEEVNEGEDRALVGQIIHRMLERLYRPYVGKCVAAEDFQNEDLAVLLEECLAELGGDVSLPPESRIMLQLAAPHRLRNYLSGQPAREIVGLEQELKAELSLWGRPFTFGGKADRIDRRENALYLVDYKTGSLRKPDTLLWNEEAFWQELEKFRARAEAGTASADEALPLLQNIRERVCSLQLPCYIALLAAMRPGERVENACLVELADEGKEFPLFSGPWTGKDYDKALLRCKQLLGLVLWHMAHTETFRPVSDQCRFCAYRGACRS